MAKAAVCSKAMVLLLLILCWLLLPLWDSAIVLCCISIKVFCNHLDGVQRAGSFA